jgi:presenilin-like A22 family membrane protease
MKHPLKLVVVLLAMFFLSQLVGIAVNNFYSPTITQVSVPAQNLSSNLTINQTTYNLPYGFNPPADTTPASNLFSIVVAIALGVVIILSLMKFRAELFIRGWFFIVITFALSLSINSFIHQLSYAATLAVIIALPLAIIKVFKRNILVHNITEILIYPGISAIIIPLLNISTVVVLLILISIYDIYAVWHVGFMQKMAKYQMNEVKVFGGFMVPYIRKEDRKLVAQLRKLKKVAKSKLKKIKVNVAMLGGGDVVFPIILAGVVLHTFNSILYSIIIALGATISLGILFYMSKKGKFYPAMPFITAGCFVALGVVYLLNATNH